MASRAGVQQLEDNWSALFTIKSLGDELVDLLPPDVQVATSKTAGLLRVTAKFDPKELLPEQLRSELATPELSRDSEVLLLLVAKSWSLNCGYRQLPQTVDMAVSWQKTCAEAIPALANQLHLLLSKKRRDKLRARLLKQFNAEELSQLSEVLRELAAE